MVYSHQFDNTIVRKYDIRGVFGSTLIEKDAYYIGRGFASIIYERYKNLKERSIVIGYDGRLSSKTLFQQLKMGILQSGINVTSIGLVPTPELYYALSTGNNYCASIMITGSHNPSEYNGFKITTVDGPFFDEDLIILSDIVKSGNFVDGNGQFSEIDLNPNYIERLIEDAVIDDRLVVAWDCGNGSSSDVIKSLVQLLPGQHHVIFDHIDGSFPNHEPDPTVTENLKHLSSLVIDKKCDIGIAFDGDADRIGIVDKNGNQVSIDKLIAILAKDIIKHNEKPKIIVDVKAGQSLCDEITRSGGELIMWKTGHSYIKAKMKETNAIFAGEVSGHIFFNDKYYGYDDGIYTAIRLLSMISSGSEFIKMLDRIPSLISTPEIKIKVDEKYKFELINRISNILHTRGAKANTIDGVRINTMDGWFLIRASNTQDAIIVRCESRTEDGFLSIKNVVSNLLKEASDKMTDLDLSQITDI